MSALRRVGVALVAASIWAQPCAAQDPKMYKDEKTGIEFGTWDYTPDASDDDDPGFGAYKFGMALPADAMTKDATEYIGILECSTTATESGWCAVSHGVSGAMTQSLLLMAWPYKDQVMTSFRWTAGYNLPAVYKGDAKLTQISSSVNDTTYQVIYRCQNCFEWDNGGTTAKVSTTGKSIVLGRAQALKAPTNPGCPDKISYGFHDNGYAQYGALLDKVVQPSYSDWTMLATQTVQTTCDGDAPAEGTTTTSASASASGGATGSATSSASGTTAKPSCGGTKPTASTNGTATSASSASDEAPTSAEPTTSSEAPTTSSEAPTTTSEVPTTTSTTPSATSQVSCAAVPTGTDATTYEYIIVGGGAGGLTMADKLSAAGHTVLLIEKGPPSTSLWGGTMKPESGWLDDYNLTRFDVPGLCNQIWHDSTGIACQDTDQMAGCVLGGGTAVNAGLWWKPNPKDWDVNFPWGWRSGDLKNATDRVFERIPGTTTPSMDGKLYRQEGFDVLAKGFNESGWAYVTPNDAPTQKNHTFGHTTYMFSGGERGGPLATYLKTASTRKTFTLWTDTSVRRVVRTGGHITGVELECNQGGGRSGIVNVTPQLGRVVLSAGTFGTAKLLMRSGFGPSDQLEVVKNSPTDGATFVSDSEWVDLPVGYNLVDHVNTDTIITHPDVVFYDFYEAWDTPIPDDKVNYLLDRTGILAQAAPNIGPMFWDEIKGSDGIVRQLQWTARVEGNDAITASKHAMTMSQYLGRGSTSRGRMTITPSLDTVVSVPPYLHDDFDREAVIQGIKNLQAALSGIKDLKWIVPSPNITVEDFVNNMDRSPATRRANHWMGTAQLGYKDGRLGGDSVVDVNTKVYGTDNLFVVDASIFPGQPTGNPSAMIVVAAEQAAARILALRPPAAGALGAQCGGNRWSGSFTCAAPYACRALDPTYSICAKAPGTTR